MKKKKGGSRPSARRNPAAQSLALANFRTRKVASARDRFDRVRTHAKSSAVLRCARDEYQNRRSTAPALVFVLAANKHHKTRKEPDHELLYRKTKITLAAA